MTSNRKIGLIGGLLLFALLAVWLLTPSDSVDGTRSSKVYYSSKWNVKYQPFDKDPRGTYLFHRLLQVHISKKDMYGIETSSELDSVLHMDKKNRTYLFVGNLFGLENAEIDSIVTKVEQGSDVFLSFQKATDNVMERFFEEFNIRSDYDEKETVFTPYGSSLMWSIYQGDTIARRWNAFGGVIAKGKSKALSSFMEMDNFLVIQMGKGKVFLHTNPNMFVNYQLKRKEGYKYAEYVIDQLSNSKDVVLLELGRLPDDFGNEDTEDTAGNGKKKDDSYLRVILEDPFLRTALLLVIAGIILYVVFRSRRKRPIVPYQGEKKDMTLAFTETITSIYYAKQNPYGLLQVQRKNFYATILKHFFVDLNRREGDRELHILAEKSNKPFDEIKAMVQLLETKEEAAVTDQTITDFAKHQREFYKDAGIITQRITQRVEKRELVFRRSIWLPALLIFSGLLFFVYGLNLLVNAKGIGIALLPLGFFLSFLGARRLLKPYFIITEDELIYYNEWGRRYSYDKADIIRAKSTKNGVVLLLQNNRKVTINYWDMSRFDRHQFEGFISKVHTLDL